MEGAKKTPPALARSRTAAPKPSCPRAGFTVVEILAASAAAAILAAVACSIIFYAHLTWRRNHADVEVQRDGTFAMDLLTRKLRAASRPAVTISAGRDRIEIATAGGAEAIYLDTDDLVYDPATGASGGEITLIRDRVAAFQATPSGDGLALVLDLADGDAVTSLRTVAHWRN